MRHTTPPTQTIAFGLFTKHVNDAIKEGFYHRPDLPLAARSTYKVVDNQHTQIMLGANLEGAIGLALMPKHAPSKGAYREWYQ